MRNIKINNEHCEFIKDSKCTTVDLPHTWNGKDGQDGGNDYYRGTCIYKKNILKSDLPEGEELYIQLDGVNSSAKVFFNDKKIAVHHGGYSTFRAKLESILDENEIKIEVDNSPNDFVYPQQADFTFYGGIYRDVSIIGVAANHFDLEYNGAPGIMVTPKVNGQHADIEMQAFADGEVKFEIIADGKIIKTASASGKNPKACVTIENAHLWNGTKDPYLYTLKASLIVNGKISDEVSTRFGIRSFEVNSQKGFILNGKEYPLRGRITTSGQT